MSTEADETCADYADALKDLTINSKPMITSLTMLAQTLWEEEKQYQPVPVPREPKEEKDE